MHGRSLLKTDDVVIKTMGQGQFWYQGVRNNLEKISHQKHKCGIVAKVEKTPPQICTIWIQ